MPKPVVVAELIRSGFVEGRHHGSVVALGPDGAVDWAVGAVDEAMLPRSCNKPLQAVAMVELGLDLPPELLALACASHSGEAFHLAGVRRILAAVDLPETALRTPPDWPLDEQERDAVLRAGGGRSPLLMNCSGKHAAMLATCVVNGWDTTGYLAPDHPLQAAIASRYPELTGVAVQATAVDGCGAPLLSTSLVGLATAFHRLATADHGAPARVADAVRRHPEWVSGTRRPERALLAALPGAIGKMGAESCFALALEDGRSFALKVDDGAMRAWPVVLVAALQRAGIDDAALRDVGAAPLWGGGARVGEIRATPPLVEQ